MRNGSGLDQRAFRKSQAGFTLAVVLLTTALLSIGLAAAGGVWSQTAQREKEKDLLFIGAEFRRAISLYYERSPGGAKQYPQKLEDLLQDQRYATTQRYLRRIYADPMTGKAEWGLIAAPGGGIMGVRSLSGKAPFKTGRFSRQDQAFTNALSYSDWQFAYAPAAPQAVPAQSPAAKAKPKT